MCLRLDLARTIMKATENLRDLGQSVWLDNITRNLLQSGVLRHYIADLSVTGLTSNPTIFDHAIKSSSDDDLKKGYAGCIANLCWLR